MTHSFFIQRLQQIDSSSSSQTATTIPLHFTIQLGNQIQLPHLLKDVGKTTGNAITLQITGIHHTHILILKVAPHQQRVWGKTEFLQSLVKDVNIIRFKHLELY